MEEYWKKKKLAVAPLTVPKLPPDVLVSALLAQAGDAAAVPHHEELPYGGAHSHIRVYFFRMSGRKIFSSPHIV